MNVRFGSLADIGTIGHVRFTPKSGHQRSDLMRFQSIVSIERAPCL